MVPSLKTLRDGSPLEIREATAEDAVPLQSYIEATSGESDFLSFGPGEFGISIEENQVFLEQCQKTDNLLYLVASSRDLIVGSLVFHGGKRPRMRHCGEFGISVSKSHWGLGVGGFLVDEMITWAKASSIVTKINLRVSPDNQRGLALYAKKGFVREGQISRDMLIDGKYSESIWMGLKL